MQCSILFFEQLGEALLQCKLWVVHNFTLLCVLGAVNSVYISTVCSLHCALSTEHSVHSVLVAVGVRRHLRCVFLSFSNRLLQTLLQHHCARKYFVCTQKENVHNTILTAHTKVSCVQQQHTFECSPILNKEHISFFSEQNLLPSPPTALTSSASYPTSQSTSTSSPPASR